MVQSLVFIVCWLGVWLLAYIVEYVNHASVWFPAAGLTFAGLLVVGSRLIPALIACAVISTLWTGHLYQLDMSVTELFLPGVVFAVTHITPYYLATSLLKRLANHQVNQLPTLLISFLIVAVISSLVTAFSVIYGLVYTGLMAPKDIATAWFPFWVGDMAGIIAMGPLFVGLICKLYAKPEFWLGELKGISAVNNSNQFGLKLLTCIILVSVIMVLAYLHPSQESNLAIFVLILPLMWISYTESPVRTALSVALFSFCVAFLVNVLSLMEFVLIYQFAICIVAASAFFGLSVPSLLAHNQELRNKTITDHLTGVASRNHLICQAEIEIVKNRSSNKPISLIVFDLDNFKRINDTLGHVQGDKVLIEISKVVSKALYPSALLSRFGGDEFVILLPDTDLNQAKGVAEKVLSSIHNLDMGLETQFTCSFGASQLLAGEEFSQWFERADRALYRAKNSGRNQVQVCEALISQI